MVSFIDSTTSPLPSPLWICRNFLARSASPRRRRGPPAEPRLLEGENASYRLLTRESAEEEVRLHLWRILRPQVVQRQPEKSISSWLPACAGASCSPALCKRRANRHRLLRPGNGWTPAHACAIHR